MPSSARRIGFTLAAASASLLLLEGVARLLPARVSGPREIVQDPTTRGEAMLASEVVPGWDLHHPKGRFGRWTYTTNQWRMRGPEYPEKKPPDAVRVILVGDSSIFGVKLEWEETLSAQLEALREERFPGVDYQVANCAAPGHSSLQSIYKLEGHCLAFRPDLVIIANLNSDHSRWTETDRARFHLPVWSRPSRLLRSFALYRTVRNLWLGSLLRLRPSASSQSIPQLDPGSAPLDGPSRVPLDEYKENLHTLARLSRSAGAEPLFLILPILAELGAPETPSDRAPRREAMRLVAEEEGARLADGHSAFQGLSLPKSILFSDGVHPSPRGALELATLLDQTLGPEKP